MTETNEVSYWRQMDFLSFDDLEKAPSVTIIGCGGIGSFAAVGLAKLGIQRLSLWDKDVVEAHNIPCQLFRKAALNEVKVTAVAVQCSSYGAIQPENIEVHNKFWDGEPLSGIVISAVDDMEVRQKLWKGVKLNPNVVLFVDGRIGGLTTKVLSAKPTDIDDIRAYERALFANEEAVALPCTGRAIIDVAFLVGALIVRVVRGFLKAGERLSIIASMDEVPSITVVRGG